MTNRIAVITHALHMFGDMVKFNPSSGLDDKSLDHAKGQLFEANMMAIPGETCKYIAEHLDAQERQLAELRARIAELESAG